VGKGDKNFLFFPDLAGYYVRFWSRLFAYFNTARRKKGGREKGEGRREK